MFRLTSSLAAVVLFLLSANQLRAGGPPWLCLPLDGVTAENASQCADLLSTKLKDKVSTNVKPGERLEVRQHAKQWYLTFFMNENVGLDEVDAALAGSKFSVPRDKLRLFGHVILEIDARQAATKDLLAELNANAQVSVAETKEKDNTLLVTIDMPYPVELTAAKHGSVGWEAFARNDFSSDQSKRREPQAAPKSLPSYKAISETVAKHKATLKNIHWNPNYACRPLGAVAE